MDHNRQVSVAKGIGITLMVVGHSGCPNYLHNFIYSFHMVLFYFLSGYFFRDDKIINNTKGYLWRKFRGLYWPYIKWSIIFILLHNTFYDIGFNETFLSHQEMWINIKRTIRGLWQGEHFLGAYWFLISLFWEIIIFSAIVWLAHRLYYQKLIPILMSLLFVIGIISVQWNINIGLQRELMVLPFFYLGYLVGNGKLRLFDVKYDKEIAYLFCLPILTILAFFVHTEIGGNNYGTHYTYIVTSFCGIYLTMTISKQMKETRIGFLFDKMGV